MNLTYIFDFLNSLNSKVVSKNLNNPFNYELPLSLYCKVYNPGENEIERYADILAGFYTLEPTEFDISVGGITLWSCSTKENKFVYNIIPIIKMLHRCLKIKNHTVPIYAVYVVIGSDEMRKYLHSNKITCQNGDKYIAYYDEMCGQVDEIVPGIFFPNFFNYQDSSISRTKIILEELIKKSWHPNRFRKWCLPYDDEFAVKNKDINLINGSLFNKDTSS